MPLFLVDEDAATHKVCYCPGYSAANANPCSEPEDFVQTAGLLYTTRVQSPNTVHSASAWPWRLLP